MYGADLEEPGLLQARTWRWLRCRILGLLGEPKTRLFRALRDREDQHTPTRAQDDHSFDDYE
ncbi:hypothetical protein [Nonomuraea dietziae]|uniref:hypothetical protein n=1 Tax=Nonomuraea dietziae TaxID=65515 RepID=UPI0033EDEE02